MKATNKILGRLIVGCVFACWLPLNIHAQDLQFTKIEITDEGAIQLNWKSQSNEVYRIEYADTLLPDPYTGTVSWQMLCDDYPSHGTNTFWLDTGNYNLEPAIPHPKHGTMRFYRIVDKGANTGPSPFVQIVSPSSWAALTGQITVSVISTSSLPDLHTSLFVDGEQMYQSDDGSNYVINTCEWPNGPHIIFATARALSALPGPRGYFPVVVGRSVSTYVPVTFSNVISKVAFSQPFFEPSQGQTQQVTASFSANVNWTLQVLDETSNAVRTVNGTGGSMSFDWDGTGDGGTNIQDGVYNYFITAQPNGLPLPSGSESDTAGGGSTGLPSPSMVANSLTASDDVSADWRPTTMKEALAAGLTSYFPVQPPLPPVRVKINGVWTSVPWEEIYGPVMPVEVQIPEVAQEKYLQLLTVNKTANLSSASAATSFGIFNPNGSNASQNTTAPSRPPTAPVKEKLGDYGIGYYSFPKTNYVPVPFWTSLGIVHRIHLEYDLNAAEFDPLPNADMTAVNMIVEMKRHGWKLGFHQYNDTLSANSMRRSDLGIGGGDLFTQVTLGIFLDHGTYGTDLDYSPGGSGSYETYFASCNESDGSSPWVRMAQFGFGGNLKWMAFLACNSLCDPNYSSMVAHGAIPLKTTHLVCGAANLSAVHEDIGAFWAKYLLGKKAETIRQAWFDAGHDAFHEASNAGATTNIISFRVAGYPECIDDTIANNTAPSSPSSEPGNLVKRDQQVFP